MVIEKTERSDMPRRALRHYHNRILSIKDEDKDEIKLGNGFLKEDLVMNAMDVQHILELFDSPDVYYHSDNDDKQIICCALDCYISDLEESKNATTKKLANAKLNFKRIDEEIRIATYAKTEMCKSPESSYRL
jgi:hypothetical protein